MLNLQYAYLYLDGASLWVAVALFALLCIGFVFMGLSYIAAERKADRLEIKYNRAKADRKVAEMELQSERIKRFKFGKGAENG